MDGGRKGRGHQARDVQVNPQGCQGFSFKHPSAGELEHDFLWLTTRDLPERVVACVVGEGEAETGPLATAWPSNRFLDPVTDGAVLPIPHLNGYKISNPTVFARSPTSSPHECA
jgi:phosphoketolase